MDHPLLPLPYQTARLIIRPPSPEYATVIQEAIEETFEALHPWMPWALTMQSLDETREFLLGAESRFQAGEDFGVVAFHKDTDQFVLCSGLHPRNWSVPKFEIGYWCRASMQGNGYTTETVKALTRLGFVTMAANRIEIHCDARNLRSRRVAELAGFHLEAILRSDDRANDGSLRDTAVFMLLPGEFTDDHKE